MVTTDKHATEQGATVLAAAHALAPRLRAAAEEIDRERRLPDDILDAMHAAGLFRMALPHDVGGLQLDPLTRLRLVEAVSAANGSAGWLLAVLGIQGYWAAGWLAKEVALELFASDPRALLALVGVPSGRAQRVPGGYRVSGRWRFASGCAHATWFASGCKIYDGDTPALAEQGGPLTANFVTPASAVTVLDTWKSLGLRGTSSHDYTMTDVFVPDGWCYTVRGRLSRLSEPFFADPVLGGSLTTVSLGIAQEAVAALSTLVQEKQAGAANRAIRDDAQVQVELGRAQALVEAATHFSHALVAELWTHVQGGAGLNGELRARYELAQAFEVDAAVQAVDIAQRVAGSSAVYQSHVLERCFRDVHTSATHARHRPAAGYRRGGRLLLGMTPEEP
jgi:alkylation response protein AidB-like acyl-CoA dehydrogenase